MRLYFNIQYVMEYNAAQRAMLPGADFQLRLTTRFRPSPRQQHMQQRVPQEVSRLERTAAESMMRRLHQDLQTDSSTAAFWATIQGMVCMALKPGMPCFIAERGQAQQVGLLAYAVFLEQAVRHCTQNVGPAVRWGMHQHNCQTHRAQCRAFTTAQLSPAVYTNRVRTQMGLP